MHDVDGNAREQFVDRVKGVLTASRRSDEAFREGGGRHGKTLARPHDITEESSSGFMVGVRRIEKSDDDAGVEVDQSHSSRRASSPAPA